MAEFGLSASVQIGFGDGGGLGEADATPPDLQQPVFVPFRFRVNLYSADAGAPSALICAGAFSEVSGLEATMTPKAIREGGRNWGEIQRAGTTSFATVVLKRGMTSVGDLWTWFETVNRRSVSGYRMRATIEVYGDDAGDRPRLVWTLDSVLPVKFKGADLSATAAQIAIEELHLVHEGLTLARPG